MRPLALKNKIWVTPLDLAELNSRAKNTLSEHLGISFTDVGQDSLTATMPVDVRTVQPMGLLHGGASCALAETVGSAAANYCIDQTQKVCVGLDININHLAPVRSGFVTAIAKPLHLGKTTQVWEIELFNDQKRRIAVSRLTLAILEKKARSKIDRAYREKERF
ncbi:MAG: hotdog fold thioesterase [Chlamydiia bacterium]|nr:hotdog fold thioesterase [Chlamydiia bacterium]